jgi:hypothetical protein
MNQKTTEAGKLPVKPMTYGHGNAIMILVADRIGLGPALVAEARKHLEGSDIHAMTGAAMEKEAVALNNRIHSDALLLEQANAQAEDLKVLYGFAERKIPESAMKGELESTADNGPQWTPAQSRLAKAEGWDIFDCSGSDFGRWRVLRIDDPQAWEDMLGFVPPALGDDEEAWKLVMEGAESHHVAARDFVRTNNRVAYEAMSQFASRLAKPR